ncbi:DUF3606 domain-containing protein [Methylorubrum thiocyanatum]|uniref:DUF3606 domain-containing protein n=1 Tax=Methylorubrum thiocyanatum TaxID=47958 RepID=UPI0035C7D499
MADDLERRGPEDKNKISLTEPWEVRYWTNRFGVTESQLRECIRKVGNGTAKVAQCLGKSWP